MHAITIDVKKAGHEFAGEWGKVYGRVWKEARQGRSIVIRTNLKNKKRVYKKKTKSLYQYVNRWCVIVMSVNKVKF